MAFASVARLEDVPEDGVIAVTAAGEEIALCKVNGVVYAISNACTHDAGSLAEGETLGYVIECPRHGSRFDIRTGRVLSLPAAEDIRVFPVRIVDGAVEVDASS